MIVQRAAELHGMQPPSLKMYWRLDELDDASRLMTAHHATAHTELDSDSRRTRQELSVSLPAASILSNAEQALSENAFHLGSGSTKK